LDELDALLQMGEEEGGKGESYRPSPTAVSSKLEDMGFVDDDDEDAELDALLGL